MGGRVERGRVALAARDREETRQLALKAMVRTGRTARRDEVVAALTKASEDGNFGVRSLAAEVLKTLTSP